MHNLLSETKIFYIVIILIKIFAYLFYLRLLKKLKINWVGFYMFLNLILLQCHQLLEAILPEFLYQIAESEIAVLLVLSYFAFGQKMFEGDDQ